MCKSCLEEVSFTTKKVSKKKQILVIPSKKREPLASTHPHLLPEWDWEENDKLGLDPYILTYGSGMVVNWKDKFWHKWSATVKNRACLGHKCPFCTGKKVGYGNDLATKRPDIAKQWHPTKNTFGPHEVTPGSNKEAWFLCRVCSAEWLAVVCDRVAGNGCPYCRGLKVGYGNDLATKRPDIAKQWHPTKNSFGSHEVTVGSRKKAWRLCEDCGHEWLSSIFNMVGNDSGCPRCDRKVSKISQRWLDSLGVLVRENNIKEFDFRVDGFDPTTNTVYEFLGDYWHGNPQAFSPKKVFSRKKQQTLADRYNQTFQRFEKLKVAGYKIFYVWENDYRNGKTGEYYNG